MKDAKPLGDILADYMKSSGLSRRRKLGGINAAWLASVGERAAKHSSADGVKQGALLVTVDSAACLQELANFRKAEILSKLRTHEGCELIHDIRFKLGTLE